MNRIRRVVESRPGFNESEEGWFAEPARKPPSLLPPVPPLPPRLGDAMADSWFFNA
jgi:hypothetical protein